jgi:hypothetical protein
MLLEKQLASTDLTKYVKSKREQFAREICLYRRFKTKIALKRITCWEGEFTLSTATWYFDESMRYLTNGVTLLSENFIKYLEKYKDIEPIEPEDIKFIRCIRRNKGTKSKKVTHYAPELKAKCKQNILIPTTEKFCYGIKFNGCCMITFNTEAEQNMFIKGLEMSKIIKDYTKIHINPNAIEEIKE